MTSPTAPVIDQYGITAPTFSEVLDWLKNQMRLIYGQDIYIDNDSQDGQFLAIIAAAINDSNAAVVAAYNAFSPSTAQGEGLSSVVKINGISRAVASYSTVDLRLVGQAGTTINNGVVSDDAYQWALPAQVVIPPAGEITATATCTTLGAIQALPDTINQIKTPTRGWQTATNPAPAAEGAPVETDAALRRRQTISVALPSRTVMEGIVGAVASLNGVTRYKAYENDTSQTDGNGIPSHSISLVVEGGAAGEIAGAIADKKTPGTGTYGTTAQTVVDSYGRPVTIRFYRPTEDQIKVEIAIKALPGYLTQIGTEIQLAVASYINALNIGESVILTRLYLPANLCGKTNGGTYEVLSLLIAAGSATPTAADIPIAFNHVAVCRPEDVVITVS